MTSFSVLMSVYYKENPSFFEQAIISILVDQTLVPDEFVLVCDGELTPGLEEVINKYQLSFPGVFKVFRKERGGLGKALNYGLLKCSNLLIARADSDDICTSDRFEKQVSYMDEHPDIGIISSYIDEYNTDWNTPVHLKVLPLEHNELYQMAKFRNPLNHMAVMMRKEDILRIGSYHHIPYVEDYELWVRAMTNGIKIANIGEVLVHARVGNGMIRRRGTKKYIKSWYTLNSYMKDVGMISVLTFIRNMIAVVAFVFLPGGLKELLYKRVLRKG